MCAKIDIKKREQQHVGNFFFSSTRVSKSCARRRTCASAVPAAERTLPMGTNVMGSPWTPIYTQAAVRCHNPRPADRPGAMKRGLRRPKRAAEGGRH